MTRSLSLPALSLALAIAGAAAPGVRAQTPAPGLFGITPAKREIVARPPVRLSPVTVRNTTPIGYRVRAFPARLVQQPDCTLAPSTDPRDLVAARKVLSVGPRRFGLGTGSARDVGLRWNLLPLRARAAALGLVVVGRPAGRRPAAGVQSILQLVGTHYLRVPGRFAVRGGLDGLAARQGAPGQLLFLSHVRNRGRTFTSPRGGRLIIRDASGRAVVRQSWPGAIVLPGAACSFTTVVTKPLPAGRYTAVSGMRFGERRRRQRAVVRFTLVGPNRLPTRALSITGVSAGGHVGEPAKVTVTVRNTGNVRAGARVRVRLLGFRGATLDPRPRAVVVRTLRPLAVGGSSDLVAELGRLGEGSYRVEAGIVGLDAPSASSSAGFIAQPRRSAGGRAWGWLGDHLLALVLLAAVATIAGLLAWGTRARARLRAELAAARAAVEQPTALPEMHERDPRVDRPAPAREPVAALGPEPVAAALPEPVAAAGPEPVLAALPEPVAAPRLEPVAVGPDPVAAPRPEPVGAAQGESGARDRRVDLNTAGVDELSLLPGIGRGAARRIIAHRELHGPFASVGDLEQVEGFDAHRVARVAGRAMVRP